MLIASVKTEIPNVAARYDKRSHLAYRFFCSMSVSKTSLRHYHRAMTEERRGMSHSCARVRLSSV